jgi:hypothetical protein
MVENPRLVLVRCFLFFFAGRNDEQSDAIRARFLYDAPVLQIVNGPEVLSKFVGETEKNVRDLFADAEKDQKSLGQFLCDLLTL